VEVRRLSRRPFQISLPFVCRMLTCILNAELGNRTYIVVHVCCAEREDCHVVRELDLVDIGAIRSNVSTIINIPLGIHQSNSLDPIPGLLGVLSIGIIVRVFGQSSADIEEASVRNRVLVVVSGEIWIHLPSKSADVQHEKELWYKESTHPPPQVVSGLTA
jgi:hypothetical protein